MVTRWRFSPSMNGAWNLGCNHPIVKKSVQYPNMSGDRYWHRWGIHAPWGKCLAHLALWMIPRSIPVRRWSWRTDVPSSLSWMNACHWISMSSFWNSLLLETPAILTICCQAWSSEILRRGCSKSQRTWHGAGLKTAGDRPDSAEGGLW